LPSSLERFFAMCPTLTCLALAFLGVDLGYLPASDGGVELIVQIDPVMFQTLRPGDPISVAVRPEVQQYRASKITIAVDNAPPRRILPSPSAAPGRGASAPPATAPIVQASPLPPSPVMPATAESPIGANGGPSLGPPGEPVHVGAPTGTPVAPTTTNEQTQGAADSRAGSTLAPGSQGGNANFNGMDPADGGKSASGTFNVKELMLYLAVIGLAASNGYVGWLFYDARQRYIGLLSSKFAVAK
jgi:hypothetical protein